MDVLNEARDVANVAIREWICAAAAECDARGMRPYFEAAAVGCVRLQNEGFHGQAVRLAADMLTTIRRAEVLQRHEPAPPPAAPSQHELTIKLAAPDEPLRIEMEKAQARRIELERTPSGNLKSATIADA